MGKGLEWGLDAGLWMVIFRARLSSSTPVTCMSCKGRRQKKGCVLGSGRRKLLGSGRIHVSSRKRSPTFNFAFAWKETISFPSLSQG